MRVSIAPSTVLNRSVPRNTASIVNLPPIYPVLSGALRRANAITAKPHDRYWPHAEPARELPNGSRVGVAERELDGLVGALDLGEVIGDVICKGHVLEPQKTRSSPIALWP
ncbi:MAG TPA: hypothetical protein VMI54_15790 [Polyangiaceae bacterium]|nr:hypothetical protein [Polyangiaceae bacterium]